jgi:anaerobic magnesium-protoporphyrin IX monomethyl ester cyclase
LLNIHVTGVNKQRMDFTLQSLARKNEPKPKPPSDVGDARHHDMMMAISEYAKPVQQKNLTPVYVDYKTRETTMVLVLCPEWSPYMPPFSLARLSGIAKAAGYETTIIDLNAMAYQEYRKDWQPNEKLPFRLWDPSSSWHWLPPTYTTDIHPILKPLLDEQIERILEMKPNVVGFSLYYISEEPSKYMMQEIKKRDPSIKISVGGPNVHKSWFAVEDYYDYVVIGEGEKNLLVMLEEIEEGIEHDGPKILDQAESERININNLPMPDYESIDFSLYDVPNGVNSEFSRGCTAKCTFCEETHFWRYRQRQAVDLIDEIEWLYYNKGTDVIWFIDSLINGNIKELRAFALACKAKELKVKWTGYARCDKRMDLEYLQDLADGGCIMFNFGCESGSQKVLDDMHKGVTVEAMEQNFIDCKKVGIWGATNWIVAFPTEDYQDYSDTMTFMWRNRNNNINNMGLGVGYGLGPETIVGQNPHAYNVSWHKYQGHWISNDFKMGGTHVMMRVKLIHMWLDFFQNCTEVPITYPIRDALKKEHYHIILDDEEFQGTLEYEEDFDYHIIKEDIRDKNGNYNVFANHLVNEIWPFLRNLWRARGGYTANIRFNPEIDLKEFGTQYGPGMFNAEYNFKIDHAGQWTADFKMKFDQVDNPYDDREPPPEGRKGPFYAQDYSRIQANTAKRARKLAKAEWDVNEGRSGQDFTDLLREEEELNASIDFSFELNWQGTGDWEDLDQYKVTLAEKAERRDSSKDLDLPQKAEMEQAITLDSIIKKKPQQGRPKLDPKLLP